MGKIIFSFSIIFAGLFTTEACFSQNASDNPVSFAKKKMKLGGQKLTVEMAMSNEQQERGLMFRRELKDDAGMLFVYTHEQRMTFWMKNTLIPLAIGFFDKKKALVDVQEMKAIQSEMQTNIPTYESKRPAMYALEVSPGWFERHHVKMGATFELLPDSAK